MFGTTFFERSAQKVKIGTFAGNKLSVDKTGNEIGLKISFYPRFYLSSPKNCDDHTLEFVKSQLQYKNLMYFHHI